MLKMSWTKNAEGRVVGTWIVAIEAENTSGVDSCPQGAELPVRPKRSGQAHWGRQSDGSVLKRWVHAAKPVSVYV
jgi:hypothetical protein